MPSSTVRFLEGVMQASAPHAQNSIKHCSALRFILDHLSLTEVV
jgi:hypothetical protein